MNTVEQQHLTGRVEKAFDDIEYYNSLGYKVIGLDPELARMFSSRKKEKSELPHYALFRQSELYSIAKEELRGYVLSEEFKQNVIRDYYRDEGLEKAGKPLFEIVLDGSDENFEFDIDTAKEVRSYLIEVSRVGGLFERVQPIRDWLTQQFLQSREGRDMYIRGAYRDLLHQSRERWMSFDDALGYELEAVAYPPYLALEATRQIKMLLIPQEEKIQQPELYEKVLQKIKESSSNALLFSNPAIQWLAAQGVTHAPESIPSLRLKHFLEIVDSGVISAFAHGTPYPLTEELSAEIMVSDLKRFQYWQMEQEQYRALFSGLKLKRFSIPFEPAPTLRLAEDETPSKKFNDWVRLRVSGTLRYVPWNAREMELFSRKVINHSLNDPKAYSLLSGSRIADEECWPEIVEHLEMRNKSALEALVMEIKTKEPQRVESKFASGLSLERQRFASEPYPSREIRQEGKNYVFEMERNFSSAIAALYDREIRDQTRDDGDALSSIARVLTDFDHQFMSVYRQDGDQKERVGAVWLDGSDRLGGERMDYYDEIEPLAEGVLAQLRPELRRYAEEFALHCGYKKLEFDSNDLIVPNKKLDEPREE